MKKEILDKLSIALGRKEEIESVIEQKIKQDKEDLKSMTELIEMYSEQLEDEFDDTFREDAFIINEDYNFVKKITKKVDTDKFVQELNTSMSTLGDGGREMYNSGIEWGVKTKVSTNRSEFVKGVKAKAEELGINKRVIAEMIKADEDKTSEKTIKYEIKGNQ